MVLLLFLLLVGGTAAAPTPESLYREARAAADRGDLAKTDAITLRALQSFSDSDDEWTWRLRTIRADYLTNTKDQPEEARVVLRRPFPKSLKGTDVEVMLLQSLAFAAKRLRDPSADALIEQAYVLAKEKHPQTLPKVLIYRMIVDPASTLKWAPEAARYAKKYGQPDFEVRARGMLGLYLANAERFDESIGMSEAALAQAQHLTNRNQSTEMKLQGNLGWGYLELGDYENAAEFFSRAHATATRTGQASDAIIWMYQLGTVRFRQGDLAGAEKQYRTAYDLATAAKHRQRPIILALLAEHSLRMGRLVDARRYCEESVRERRVAKDIEGEMRSLTLAAGIAIAEGRLDRIEELLRSVLVRTKSDATKSEAHRRLAQLYVRQGKSADADHEFRSSVSTAREARAKVGTIELRFSYFNAVAELFESYVDFLVAHGRNAEALAVTEMSRAQTLGEALPDVTQPRDMRLVARENKATVLCYWLGSARSYLWIVTPKKIDVVVLPPQQEIETTIDAYQRTLLGARGSLTMSGTRGEELWRMLAAPASRFIAPQSRVIIVPHGRLAAFNMETLVVPTPKPHYWIEDVIVSTAGSLALLSRNETNRNAAPRLLLVGNPPPPTAEFAPLPRAGEEMQKVARHFASGQAVILEGAKATPSAYRAKLPGGFSYLHFVAHGVATRLKPLDSAVVLAREGDVFKLYARDIARQPLTAKLVTISSCHGAGTRAYSGEGLVGLAWAFLRAGADNVVAALWEVNDAATPDLMDRFYEKLANGADPATALRDAKLSLVRGGDVYAKPLYWAPFLLYGSS
jgi:CHAT domain-containing protein/tetratricopeptide (TPR) repeat protein